MFLKSNSLILYILIFILLAAPFYYLNAEECPPGVICIQNPLEAESVEEIINSITDFLRLIAMGIGLIMIIWGGIQILTAAGSEEKLTKGKKTIMWTIIGVAIVFLFDFIVGFVLEIIGAE